MKKKILEFLKNLTNAPFIAELIKGVVVKFGLKSLGGVYGFIAGFIIEKLIKYGLKKAKEEIIEEQVETENEEIMEHYEEVTNNPNSSQSDIDSATESFLGVRVRKRAKSDSVSDKH